MKPPPFRYSRPSTVADAVAVLSEHADDASVLAGGQSLVPLLNFRLARPEWLIDINDLSDLAFIECDEQTLRIGALTRMEQLRRSEAVRERFPMLAEAASHVGHFQIRNRGTVGGSVAHADPLAEIPAALLALDATFRAESADGSRTIPAGEFFQGYYSTALNPGELLTEIVVRYPQGVGAFEEFARRPGDFAQGAIACQLERVNGRLEALSLVAVGLEPRPVRLVHAEERLALAAPDAEAVRSAVASEISSSYQSSDAFKKRLVVELATRAYARAIATSEAANGA